MGSTAMFVHITHDTPGLGSTNLTLINFLLHAFLNNGCVQDCLARNLELSHYLETNVIMLFSIYSEDMLLCRRDRN